MYAPEGTLTPMGCSHMPEILKMVPNFTDSQILEYLV